MNQELYDLINEVLSQQEDIIDLLNQIRVKEQLDSKWCPLNNYIERLSILMEELTVRL